jgi:hypothetical protein
MTDNGRKDSKKAGELDRRSVLVGTAATAATASLPGAAVAGDVGIQSAVYMDPIYLKTFRDKQTGRYSKHRIGEVWQIIRDNFATRADLTWGSYQQKVETDKTKWGGSAAYDNWPIFVQESREDLEKQPAPSSSDRRYAMDPSNTSRVAANRLEHLDEVIRIALWDHKNVSVWIDVGKHKRRHHDFATIWDFNGNQLDNLTINVDCPEGGWQGYTIWPFKAPTAHITGLTATWQVPPPPDYSGDQILFIFNGIESSSTKTVPGGILQPVLQWTRTGWAVRSWYVRADFDPVAFPDVPDWTKYKSQADIDKDDVGRCYTKAIPVNRGDKITGTITGGLVNGKYNYTCSLAVGGVNQNDAKLSVMDIPELSYPVCAVESYGIRDNYKDKDYPAGLITMTDVGLQIDGGSVTNIQWKESKKKGGDYDPHSSMQGKKIEFKRT